MSGAAWAKMLQLTPQHSRPLSRPMTRCPPERSHSSIPLRRFLHRRASEAARSIASRGFSPIAPGLNQHTCRNAEFVMQLADHIEGQRAFAPQHFIDPRALPDHSDQGTGILSFLFEAEFDCFHRLRTLQGIVLSLIRFAQY